MSIVFSTNFKVYKKNPIHKAAQVEWVAWAFIEFWRRLKILREPDWSIVNRFNQYLR